MPMLVPTLQSTPNAASKAKKERPARAVGLAMLAFLMLASTAPDARALAVNPGSSTLSVARGCTSANCFFSEIFTLTGTPSVSGSFDIVGTTLTFSIDLLSASLPGSDGPVTGVVFSGVNYSGSFTVTDEGSNMYSFLDQSSTVSGTMTPTGAGSPVVFDITPVNTTGNCSGTPGSSLVCGLQFGAGIGFAIDVNGNQRYFNHNVNVFSVIPEPGTATLFGLGLVLLGAGRRNESRLTR